MQGDRGFGRAGWAVLVACLVAASTPSPARAERWSDVFAAVHDTVVFLGLDGALYRAPFHLATRETVWTPRSDEMLARFVASPEGGRIAYVTRQTGSDLTRLWVDGRLRTGFFPLLPAQYQQVRYESSVPSLEDGTRRGVRLIQPNALMQRRTATTLAWTLDGRLAFGFDDGIGALPADTGSARQVSRALALRLIPLEPSPMFLLETLALRDAPTVIDPEDAVAPPLEGGEAVRGIGDVRSEGRKLVERRIASIEHWLLYPAPGRWRVFPAASLRPDARRAASESAVWWAEGSNVRVVRAHDPNVATAVRLSGTVTWIAFDPSRRAVLAAGPREVVRLPEDGGPAERVRALRAPPRELPEAEGDDPAAFTSGDSLFVLDPRTGALASVALGGVVPVRVLADAFGAGWAVLRQRSNAPALARIDLDARRLDRVETPSVPRGRVAWAPDRRHLLLYDPGPRPPATVQVFDTAARGWHEVETPAISGWEPLAIAE